MIIANAVKKASNDHCRKKKDEGVQNWCKTYFFEYLSEKDDGALEGGGEVEGRVRVALAGRALAEVADDHQAVLGALERVRRAGSYKI